MRGNGRLAAFLVALIAAAALAVAGCGGDDETTTSTSSVETTTGATGATGASGAEGAAGGTYAADAIQTAFEDEGFATNDATDAALTTPQPETAISLVEQGETVANGTVYVFADPKDAEEAEKNLTPSDNLDRIVVGNVLVEASTDPQEGFPTANEMAQTVEQSG